MYIGAFHVEMRKDEYRDRAIQCCYNPTEVGQYVIHIQWSGDHVPGSPFTVAVVDTCYDLNMFTANNLAGRGGQFLTASQAGVEPPLVIHSGPDYDGGGTLKMSTLSGDGLYFNDDG